MVERFRLTVKGYLQVKLNLTDKELDNLWFDLRTLVEAQARANGSKGETPALVFNGGGDCIMLTKKKEKKRKEDANF